MGKILGFLLRYGLVAACIVYVFWGVDWPKFWQALLQFGLLPVAGAIMYSFVPYVPLALRFNYLTGHKAGFLTALKASVFCLGINNIFPAKLGEVAKAFYLRRKTGISVGKGLGFVFWERFADLNTLLVLCLVSVFFLGKTKALIPLAIVVGTLWFFVLLFRFVPSSAEFFLKFIPTDRLKLVASEVLTQLKGRMSAGFFFSMGAYSALFWFMNITVTFVVLFWVAQLDLSLVQGLTVFVIVTLGFATPSSPGAIGLVEAAFVLSLGWFGVEKETALAVALIFRFVSFVPPTLSAMYVLAESGLSIKNIKERDGEDL